MSNQEKYEQFGSQEAIQSDYTDYNDNGVDEPVGEVEENAIDDNNDMGIKDENKSNAKKKNPNGKIIKGAIIGVVVLFIGLGSFVLMNGKKNHVQDYQPPQDEMLQAQTAESDSFEPTDPTPHPSEQTQTVEPNVTGQGTTTTPVDIEQAQAVQQTQSKMLEAQKAMIDEINSLRERVALLEKDVNKMKVPFYRTKNKADSSKAVGSASANKTADASKTTDKSNAGEKSSQAQSKASASPIVSVGVVETPKVEVAPISPVSPAKTEKTVELSSDVFTLKGVLAGMAWVVYKPDGKMYIVRVGDKLPNGATVQRIDAIQHYVGTTLGGIQ